MQQIKKQWRLHVAHKLQAHWSQNAEMEIAIPCRLADPPFLPKKWMTSQNIPESCVNWYHYSIFLPGGPGIQHVATFCGRFIFVNGLVQGKLCRKLAKLRFRQFSPSSNSTNYWTIRMNLLKASTFIRFRLWIDNSSEIWNLYQTSYCHQYLYPNLKSLIHQEICLSSQPIMLSMGDKSIENFIYEWFIHGKLYLWAINPLKTAWWVINPLKTSFMGDKSIEHFIHGW